MNEYTCLNPGDGPCGVCSGCQLSADDAADVILPPAQWSTAYESARNRRLYEILYDDVRRTDDEFANQLWYLLAAPPSRWQRIKQAVRGYVRRRLGRASRPYGYWMDIDVKHEYPERWEDALVQRVEVKNVRSDGDVNITAVQK